KKLTNGVHLAEGFAKATRAKVIKKYRDASEVEIVLDEGRNREVRRLLASINHKVLQLKRIAIGPLQLGAMTPGQWRRLTGEELASLRKATSGNAPRKKPAARRKWSPVKKKKKSVRRGGAKKSTKRPPKKRRG
ncbi:MAG: pseudouridine synthase, partial [bacterium]|nr:pseudouridine synthase [bacterium]